MVVKKLIDKLLGREPAGEKVLRKVTTPRRTKPKVKVTRDPVTGNRIRRNDD